MSHFTVVVFTKDKDNPMQDAERLLAPYDEQGEWFAEGSRWDWYTLGGRWDGAMVKEDPEIVHVPCTLCGSTGTRPREELITKAPEYADDEKYEEWRKQMNGCNGCSGKGYREEQPRYYAGEGDLDALARRNIVEVSRINEEFYPFAFITPDGMWTEKGRMGWWAMVEGQKEENNWKGQWDQAKADFADCLAVLVDCHV